MESHEVLKEALDSPHAGPKEVAEALGVSLSLVYKWAQPGGDRGSGSRNPLDRVESLVGLTRHEGIVEWLCQRAGGYFVRNPKGCPTSGYDVVPATHQIVQQFAGLLDAVSRAAQDNEITLEEAAEIRVVWDRLKAYCEGFVRCCEEGNLEPIQKKLKTKG
jgi:transposase